MRTEDGLTKEEIDQLLNILSNEEFSILYDFIWIKNSDSFKYLEPLYYCSRERPTVKDVLYADQHYDKLYENLLSKLEDGDTIEVGEFASIFEKMFHPREISAIPIINYLIHKEKIMYANEKIQILELIH